MTDTEAYRATLDRLESDLAKAQAHTERLRAGITAIRALLADDDARPATAKAPGAPQRMPQWGALPPGTTMKDAAIYALKHTGKPMRLREIFTVIMSAGFSYGGGWKRFRNSMAPTMNRDPIFKKVGVGLYELASGSEMQKPQGAEGTLGLLEIA